MSTDVFPGATLRQLLEWGYPQGILRPLVGPDLGIGVVHITGNPGNPIATAAGELAWRINDPANQNSATFFVDRDGRIYQGLADPLRMAPWSNGDLNQPDTANRRIAAIVRDRANANQRTILSIENVGNESTVGGITAAQVESNARIFAHYFPKAGLPITRETIVGHYQINRVSRPNCPGTDKRVLDRIVARAQQLVAPAPEEDDMDARPGTFIAKPGKVALVAGWVYNAFRLVGRNADGSPILKRYNGIKYPAGTSADVIGVAHWDEGKPAAEGYLVSPYCWVPEVGHVPLLWWSSSPAAPPVVTWTEATGGITQGTVDKARLAGRTEGADLVLEAAKAAAKPLGAS